MLTVLLWLSPFIALAVIVWNYRRKVAERDAASNARLREIFGKNPAEGAGAAAPTPITTAAAVVTPAPATQGAEAAPAPASMRFTVHERLLTPPQTLLYYLLKSSLPDHEVLAQASASGVIDVPDGVGGFERETRQRRLAAAVLDFVVCDKSFTPVAVVQCGARVGSAAESLAFARTCCESAALRWVEVAPDTLPKRETVRAVVLGAQHDLTEGERSPKA